MLPGIATRRKKPSIRKNFGLGPPLEFMVMNYKDAVLFRATKFGPRPEVYKWEALRAPMFDIPPIKPPVLEPFSKV